MKVVFALIAFFALVAVATRGAGARPANGPAVEINALLPLTGPAAFLGQGILQTLRALELAVNQDGGVRGRPIKFIIADDQMNPQVSVQLVTQLDSKHVPVILGPALSATCGAVMPLIADGPVVYCFSPALHPPQNSYMFSATVGTDDLLRTMIRYCRERGWTRLALVNANDASGQDLLRQINETLNLPENRSMQLVARESFNPTDLSANAQMVNVKSAGAQVLLTGAIGSAFATLLRGFRDSGLDLPVFSSGGNMTHAQMATLATFLPRELYFPGIRGIAIEPQAPRPVKEAQMAYYAALTAVGAKPDYVHSSVWDASMLVVDALRHVGPDAGASQIHDYIEGLTSWAGISGTYDFHKVAQRGIGEGSAMIYRWDSTTGEFIAASKPSGYLK